MRNLESYQEVMEDNYISEAWQKAWNLCSERPEKITKLDHTSMDPYIHKEKLQNVWGHRMWENKDSAEGNLAPEKLQLY